MRIGTPRKCSQVPEEYGLPRRCYMRLAFFPTLVTSVWKSDSDLWVGLVNWLAGESESRIFTASRSTGFGPVEVARVYQELIFESGMPLPYRGPTTVSNL